MGGGKKQTVGYRYYLGLHMGLCHGPVDALLEVRAGDRTAWKGAATGSGQIYIEAPDLFGGDDREGGVQGALDVMMGEPTQAPNDYLAAQQGAAQPAYRGLLSLVFRGPSANNRAGITLTGLPVWLGGGSITVPLSSTGGSFLGALIARLRSGRLTGLVGSNNPYIKPWAFLVRRITAGWTTAAWYPSRAAITIQGDVAAMNPAHIVYECLTNTAWGLGYPTGQLDAASFTAAADTFHAEGLGLCMAWQQQDSIQSFLQVVMDHAGAVLVQDRATGLFRLRAIRGDYTLASLPLFGTSAGNVLEVSRIERSTNTETVNEITVAFTDALTGKEGSVTVQQLASIQATGAVVPETRQYPGLPTSALALRTAMRDLRAATSGLARVTMTVNRTGYGIVPGDVIRFEWLPAGIASMALRVVSVDYGNLTEGAVALECVEDVFSLPATTYVAPQSALWTSPDATPQASPFVSAFEIPYRELAQAIGRDDAAAVTSSDGYLGFIAVRPIGLPVNYALETRAGSAEFQENGNADWTPATTLSAAITPATTSLPIVASPDLYEVLPGTLAMLGSGATAELVRVDTLNVDTGTITVGRGCVDTVPRSHPSGTRLLFIDNYTASDGIAYTSGEVVQARARTRTVAGLMEGAVAPSASITIAGRAARPYPPGNLRFNGAAYPASITGALTVSWSHRDRVLQDDQLLDTTAGNVGPEAGTTYTLRLYDENGTLRRTETGLTGTSYAWTTESTDSNLSTVPSGEYTGIAWAQSSVYSAGLAANATNMRDSNINTGGATNATSDEWIRADLGSAQSVQTVAVAGGTLPGWGSVAPYLNGATIQWASDPEGPWTTVATVSGVDDTGALRYFGFAPVVARYWRIRINSFLATTEFRIFSGAGGARLNTQVRAELWAVRGGVESFQRHDITVARV